MDSSLVEGYVSPQTYLRPDGIEVLSRSAQAVVVPYEQVRAVYFVREFDGFDGARKRVFGSRPKVDGLWVRLTFRDDEVFEGVIPNDLLGLQSEGVTFTPPDAAGNTQRIFVPAKALSELKVLGVIGSPVHRRRPRGPAEPTADQIKMFSQGGGS
jgi:hypothetical protein